LVAGAFVEILYNSFYTLLTAAQSRAENHPPRTLREEALPGSFADLPRVAFWLVPHRRERAALQSLINELARHFSAPVFVPHVTVYSCRRTPAQRELAVMAALAGTSRPVVTRPTELACSGRLTQTLFARLADNPAVDGLYRALHAEVPLPSDYQLNPHLSLLYQRLAAATRDTLVRETALCLSEIRLDSLWAVAIPEQLMTLEDLRDWQPLLISRLEPAQIVDTLDN
jgi:putative hydrolase of the HAD superfamily